MQTDTHTYDGKLHERKKEIEVFLTKIRNQPFQKKYDQLISLKDKIPLTKIQAHYFMNLIISDYKTYPNLGGQNYDPTNDLHAEDLLCIFSHIYELEDTDKKDAIQMLCIQLEDMATGFCPQGRTTRLFQLVIAFL
jgi:hypothetical protein